MKLYWEKKTFIYVKMYLLLSFTQAYPTLISRWYKCIFSNLARSTFVICLYLNDVLVPAEVTD